MPGGREARDRHDVQRVEHGRDQGEHVSPAEAHREVVAEREQPDAQDAERRGDDARGAGTPAGDRPVDEGHHHAVGRGQKSVAPGRGVGEADVLHDEGGAGQDSQHGAAAQGRGVEVRPHALPEQRADDQGREEEPHEHEPARGHNVERTLDDDERAAPDGGGSGQRDFPHSCGHVFLCNHGGDYTAGGKFLAASVACERKLP